MQPVLRLAAALLVTLALASSVRGACDVPVWDQNWFDADAIHYTAGDLDGNGVPEIISASTTTVSYRRATDFAAFPVYTATAIGAPAASDVTGDGKIDLVIPNDANDTLVVLPGNGNGTFGAAVTTALSVSPSRFVLGNFSGNAQRDVALIGSSASSPLIFLEGNGTGAFTQVGTVAIASSPLHLATANFDADGYDDVAVSHTGSTTLEVVFPNGSGGASTIVPLDGGDSALLATGDYDGDGDADLYAIRPTERRLDVFPNGGARIFGTVSQSNLWSITAQGPRSIALADFDGDLDLDLAIARPGFVDWLIRTPGGDFGGWSGGNWTQPFPWAQTNNGRSIAAADFTGDGRIDLAIENAASGRGGLFVNRCDTVGVFPGLQHRITLGQSTRGNVIVYGTGFGAPYPIPTGTVRLTWSGGEKTVTLVTNNNIGGGIVFFDIAGLPLGFQRVVADYSGDANYPPATNSTWIIVTTDTTTTTISGPSRWTYGERPKQSAVVTSSTGDTPTGDINLDRNGTSYGTVGQAPAAEWDAPQFPAGTHTISAKLGYSETHPPSTGSMQVTIDKATSTLGLDSGTISRAGQTAWIQTTFRPQFFAPVSGTVRVMEGATTLATTPLSPYVASWQYPQFHINGLSVGTHALRVVYDGDANVEGTSLDFEHTVLPANTVLPLVATGHANYAHLEFLSSTAPNTSLYVYRRVVGGPWTQLGWASNRYFFDSNVTAGSAYQYRVDALGHNGQTVSQSNVETVYIGTFTDASLTGARIRKVHFTEVQSALNTFRAMAGLPALQIDFTGPIRASHITQMRNALNEARTALGMPAASFGEAPVAGVTRIRASDLQQLRDALR